MAVLIKGVSSKLRVQAWIGMHNNLRDMLARQAALPRKAWQAYPIWVYVDGSRFDWANGRSIVEKRRAGCALLARSKASTIEVIC